MHEFWSFLGTILMSMLTAYVLLEEPLTYLKDLLQFVFIHNIFFKTVNIM